MKVYLVYDLGNLMQHELFEVWRTEEQAQARADANNARDYPDEDRESENFEGWFVNEVEVQG